MKPGKHTCTIAAAIVILLTFKNNPLAAQAWKLIGNAGTTPATHFMGTIDNQPLVFKTLNTEVMRITASEKIGIGTTSPTSHVHINGYAGEDLLHVQAGGSSKLFVNSLGVSIGSSTKGPNNGLYVNGFVGIGTSTPGYQLDVVGAGRFSSRVGIMGGVNSGYALNVNANSTNGGINITDPIDGYIIYGKKSGANNALSLTKTSVSSTSSVIYGYNSGGGIGITGSAYSSYGVSATSNSSYAIYAYSSGYRGLYASTGLGAAADYAAYFNGNIYATGLYKGSDKKLKKNITELGNALDIINRLKPKKYEYRNDGSFEYMQLPKGQRYGLIAQEVEEIMPNAVMQSHFRVADAMPVKGDEDNAKRSAEVIDFKAVDYTELIPVLIKAVQELQAEVEELKKAKPAATSTLSDNITTEKLQSSSASLAQNAPNPLRNSTTIRYTIPSNAKSASLAITDMSGKPLRQITLQQTSAGVVNIDAGNFNNGAYMYTLLVDGKAVASKRMVVNK